MKATTGIGMCTAALLAEPFAATDDDVRAAVDAAAGAGCPALSVWSHQLVALGDPAQLAVPVAVVEGALLWSGPDEDAAASEARTLCDQAEAHGARLILAVVLDAEPPDAERARAGLGHLGARAAEVGARVCVEFLPWSGLPSLAAAWELVRPLDAGVGIVIDAWHWQRQPGGPCPDVLAGIPGERIAYLQLCDAGPEAGPEPMDETMNGRLLPGDGVVEFAPLVAGLDAIGADPFVATEVFNPALVRERGAAGAAGAMGTAARRVLAAGLPAGAAGPRPPGQRHGPRWGRGPTCGRRRGVGDPPGKRNRSSTPTSTWSTPAGSRCGRRAWAAGGGTPPTAVSAPSAP